MTIRWKLNLAILALIAVFLAAAAVSMYAVRTSGAQTQAFLRTRELAQFTADIRTTLIAQVAAAGAPQRLPPNVIHANWVRPTLDDVDVKIRLSTTEAERDLWLEIRAAVEGLAEALTPPTNQAAAAAHLQTAERDLRSLRHLYDVAQADALALAARAGFHTQLAIGIACALTALLLAGCLIMTRRWLIQPVEVLKRSAEVIGHGDLTHRVPLTGGDELAQLARHFDAMADGLHRHQRALLEARELSAIGELCANVAHGLRNPLAAIRTSAQLAERRAERSDQDSTVWRELANEADRMDQRITRLFEFSKPMQLAPTTMTFADLASDAIARAQPLLNAYQITLKVEDATHGERWSLDRQRLTEALGELITNAAHHSSADGTIALSGETLPPDNGSGRLLRVQVVDRGKGMSPATLEKAFDLFFTARPEGSGMGLALARRVVTQHRGELTLASQPGQGTTATFTLRSLGL